MARPHIVGNSLKVTTMAFSQLFRDMYVYNYDDTTGKPLIRIPVNVGLDTKESIYTYLKMGGSHKKIDQKDTLLPRIGIQISSMTPDMSRQSGKGQTRTLYKSLSNNDQIGNRMVDKLKKDIQPVPLNITYTVSIWCKYIDHWAQIQENILPFFDPYCTVGVRERDLGIEREIPVKLESVTPNMSFEVGNNSNQRLIRSEMEFTCETVIYKHMSEKLEGIINQVYVWTIDVDSPFSSTTMSLSGAPVSDIPASGSPATSGSPISGA